MKYNEFINESFVNESNESAMASDAIKATIFKIQKPLEAAFKKFEKIGVFKSFKLKVQPFNGGWEMQLNTKEDHKRIWEVEDMISEDLFNNLSRIVNLYSVSIYPTSWFEENFEDERGGTSSFTVTNLNILADIKTQTVVVNGRSDIKPKLKVIEDQLLKQVKYISDEIDKIEKIVSNEPTNESRSYDNINESVTITSTDEAAEDAIIKTLNSFDYQPKPPRVKVKHAKGTINSPDDYDIIIKLDNGKIITSSVHNNRYLYIITDEVSTVTYLDMKEQQFKKYFDKRIDNSNLVNKLLDIYMLYADYEFNFK